MLGWAASTRAANERAEAFRPHIEWALRQPGLRGKRITFDCAADKLNERNIKGSMGGLWRGHQVQSMAIRLGIYHPLHHVRLEVARAAVRAILKQHPEFSARKVQAIARLERPLGYNRTYKLLTQFRLADAKRSPVHRMVGWPIDEYTAARIRIGAIWKRHPEFTAKQVLKKLGPKHSRSLSWVSRVVQQCWRAARRRSFEERRIGRRVYGRWWPRKPLPPRKQPQKSSD